MAEYIEREALIAELSKGTIITDDLYGMGIMAGVDAAMKKVAEQPAADVVEVVRCKDCKFQVKAWHEDKRMKDGGYWVYQCDRNEDPFVCHSVNGCDDEFCSYGERKE